MHCAFLRSLGHILPHIWAPTLGPRFQRLFNQARSSKFARHGCAKVPQRSAPHSHSLVQRGPARSRALMQDKAVATSPSDLMSSCNAGQLPYKERLQRTLTQQDETVVLLLKNARTVSDTAVENVLATQEKMRKESDRSGEEKVERPGRTRRRTGGGED